MSGPWELGGAVVFLVFETAVKLWDVFHLRFDSDEFQHLHVVWAWTRGMVQYRDVFANHMPLFHLACAPLLALMGEHARDLLWMRLLMLPLFFGSAWLVYRIGSVTVSRRVGIWSVLLVGAYWRYQSCSTEYRTDNLWMLLWLLCLFILVSGRLSLRRSLAAGVVLGLCFGVSMKSTILLLALAIAGGIALLVSDWQELRITWPAVLANAFGFIAATAAVPLSIAAFFAARGLWPQFRYCVVEHNFLPGWSPWKIYLRLFIAVAISAFVAWLVLRETARSTPFARLFVCLAGAASLLVLRVSWNHITRQNYLPILPLISIALAAWLCGSFSKWLRSCPQVSAFRSLKLPVVTFATLALLIFSVAPHVPLNNQTAPQIKLVRQVLMLTAPNDYVFDCKGETIFRPRSSHLVMESLTLARLRYNLLVDDVEQRCIETHTVVAVVDGLLPVRAREFILGHYISVAGPLRVAGKLLPQVLTDNGDIACEVTIPASYELVSPEGAVSGTLDGTSYDGARWLDAGMHHFRPNTFGTRLALLWAPAVKRHFWPEDFGLRQPSGVGRASQRDG